MKIKNKLTKEVLELSYVKFKEKFSKEIQQAYESFKKIKVSKNFYKPACEAELESEFYFGLQWNCGLSAEGSSQQLCYCVPVYRRQPRFMKIQTGILKNFSIVSAPRKNQKENLGQEKFKK